MRNLVRECAGWINWKLAVGGLVALALLAACAKLPSLSALIGAAPLLLIAACLAPCLIPLALMRRARPKPPASERE